MEPRESSWVRAGRYALPSIVAATAASFVVGLLDGARNTYTILQAVAATGYVSVYAIPIGILIGLLARAVASSWRAEKLVTRAVEPETGGAPVLAAMFVYAMTAAWFTAGVALNALRLLIYRSPAKPVVIFGTTIAVTIAVAGLVVLSKPVVGILTRAFRYVDRWTYKRWSKSFLTPKLIIIGGAATFGALLIGAWFVSLRPRLADIDLGFYGYVVGFFALLAGVQCAWLYVPAVRRARAWAIGGVAGALVATSIVTIGTGFYVRHKRPYAMLEVWGNTVLAGVAVDRLFNIQLLRRDLRLPGLRPKPWRQGKHPNVVLITIDNARADRTGWYSGRTRMPTMQRLRREGTVFDWAFAAGTVTRRSLPSIVLGVGPNRVRGRVTGQTLRLDPRHVLLAERFRAAGYETAGFLGPNRWFSPSHNLGLARGFDHLAVPSKAGVHNSDGLVRLARAWLRDRNKRKPTKPLFLWVHLSDLTHWRRTYTSSGYGRNLRPRYDMACQDVDKYLGFLLVDVWNSQTKHNTILLIAGDHGVALDEEKQTWTTGPLGTGRLRVPLYIAGVGRRGRRIQVPVGMTDIAPTLLDLAGFIPPKLPHMDGRSFAKLLRNAERPNTGEWEAYSVIVKDGSVPQNKRALMHRGYKLIEHDSDRPDELYSYRGDPRERRNLVRKKPRMYERLKARMSKRRALDRVAPF